MLPLKEYPYWSRPMILAHRGDSSEGAPENSLAAIEAAIALGVDMIEVDVQWSVDEEFVCYHDASVGETVISETNYEALAAKNIASLTSILALGKDKVYFNLEVKEYSARDPKRFMSALQALCERLGVSDHVLFSSFRIDFLRELQWGIPTVLIRPDESMQRYFNEHSFGYRWQPDRPIATYMPSELVRLSGATAYACQLEELTPEAIADIRKYNILLSVYTITTQTEFELAIDRGAKALVCDNLRDMLALRNAKFPVTE